MEKTLEEKLIDRKPLVLIVDDIPRNLQVLSNILNSEGYQISFANNGNQALSVIESTLPDLILLDIMMPEMDGYEVCELLKSRDETKHIPIIFLTGKAETDDIVKGFRLGAVDYITKPFNSIELLSRVHTHLELKLSRDSIMEYNRQLKEYQEELKSVINSKDKFFSIIAHDLRGPFSGFLGLSELLVDEYEQLDKEEITQIASSMNKAASRLFAFLENLLDWSRTQMGRMEYNPMPIELDKAVRRVTNLLSTVAEKKSIHLENAVAEGIVCKADNNMLSTILRNLINNSIKFTNPDGKVSVSAEEYDDKFFVVHVADTGVGIPDEAKEKLFKIESKYSTPGTNNEAGTGLGIILCKELVETHGGSIWVESKVNEGTTFSFTLPKN